MGNRREVGFPEKLLGNSPNSSGFHTKIKNLDQWLQIEERFEIHPLATQTRNDYQAILIDRESGTICHVQILASQLGKVEQYLAILATLAFHPAAPESIWTLQDATFSIPAEATLEDYGFKAGLSWARFRQGPNSIQLARLAPADQRLSQTSPDSILEQLSGARDLQNEPSSSLHDTELSRKPSLLSQVGYRLKRHHPFIQAALRHLTGKNILAGCIISSRQPIPIDTAIQLLPQE